MKIITLKIRVSETESLKVMQEIAKFKYAISSVCGEINETTIEV